MPATSSGLWRDAVDKLGNARTDFPSNVLLSGENTAHQGQCPFSRRLQNDDSD
jgi:hypothetical protein